MILEISAKCDDRCFLTCYDVNSGLLSYEKDGYVPSNLGIGGGDYIKLSIDTDTGWIVDFIPLTLEEIGDAFVLWW